MRKKLPAEKKADVQQKLYISRELKNKLDAYAESKGLQVGTAARMILTEFFNSTGVKK